MASSTVCAKPFVASSAKGQAERRLLLLFAQSHLELVLVGDRQRVTSSGRKRVAKQQDVASSTVCAKPFGASSAGGHTKSDQFCCKMSCKMTRDGFIYCLRKAIWS